jgi:hypothetical protein
MRFGTGDERVVVNKDEVRLVGIGPGDPCGAMRPARRSRGQRRHALALGSGQKTDRVVVQEDRGELVIPRTLRDFTRQDRGVGGRRTDQIMDRRSSDPLPLAHGRRTIRDDSGSEGERVRDG